MGMVIRRLVDFPYVLVRLRCDACKRAGSYRLARLAVKYRAEILLSAECPWRDDPRGTCGAVHRFAAKATAGLTGSAYSVPCYPRWKIEYRTHCSRVVARCAHTQIVQRAALGSLAARIAYRSPPTMGKGLLKEWE
jgi:hypothetical protein